jgi:hypothetical protein
MYMYIRTIRDIQLKSTSPHLILPKIKAARFAEKVRLHMPMIGKIIKTLVFINHSSNIMMRGQHIAM